MVGKTQGTYAATYVYRFGDKLKAVTSNFPGETASVAYNYDGLGRRRLEQRDNTTATWFRWSGGEECGEYAGTVGSWTIGSLQTGYVPGLATFAGSNPATAEWRYHLTDHLGSVHQLSGQTKAALALYDYAPYGELMRSAGLPLTVGYTGHLWDAAIGQYYAPFRYYNPQNARWNMRDPLGMVDGPNMYAYVVGNPVNYIDIYGGSILGDSIDYLADLGDCLDGKRVIIKPRRKGRHFASEFPSWWGLPFIPLPKLPKNLGRFSILKPYTRIMGSRYTSIPSILRASIPYSKFPGLSSTRYWLRIASKASPWITIADGVISWARIGQCATKI